MSLLDTFEELNNNKKEPLIFLENEYMEDLNTNSFYDICEELNEENSPEISEEAVDNVNEILDNPKAKNELSQILDNIYRSNNGYILSTENSEQIPTINNVIKAGKIFGRTKVHWAYQLQLLLNAWISEQWVLTNLKEKTKFYDYVNNYYSQYFNQNLPYIQLRGDHNLIYQPKFKKSVPQRDKADAEGIDIDNKDFRLEVKVVKTRPSDAKQFHEADVIVIIAITTKKVYLKFKIKDSTGNDIYKTVNARNAYQVTEDLRFIEADVTSAVFKYID